MKYNHSKQLIKKWNSKEQTRKFNLFYQEGNPLFNSYYGFRHQVRQKRLLEYLDSLHLKKGARILELGYGAGMTAVKVLEKGFHVTGVDISEEFKEIATKNCKNFSSFDFRIGNAEKLDLPSNYFDCVIEMGMLHYLENPLACIEEVKRVLKPGGYFILTQRNKYGVSTLKGLAYFITQSKYELKLADTFLLRIAIVIFSLFSKKHAERLVKYHKTKRRVFCFGSLKKMLEKANLTVLRYDGIGYLSRTGNILFPKIAKKVNNYLQKANDNKKIPCIHKFGNSVIFLTRKDVL